MLDLWLAIIEDLLNNVGHFWLDNTFAQRGLRCLGVILRRYFIQGAIYPSEINAITAEDLSAAKQWAGP